MKPPTLKQVIAYFIQSGSNAQLATIFYDRYTANGWTATRPPTAETNWQATRKPMKNWKNAVAYFIKHNQLVSKRSPRAL